MDELSIDEQLEKLVRNCKWAEIVQGVSISRAKQYLQRCFYSAITILGIDLKRSKNNEYLIKADGRYQTMGLEDWEKCIREIAFITGLENYAIGRDYIEFVLERTYKRKEVI